MSRFHSQKERQEHIQQVFEETPITTLSTGQPETWRHVSIPGRFLGPFYLVEGRHRYSQPGYDIIQAFNEEETEHFVLVNRGWIPIRGHEQRIAWLRNKEPDENENPVELMGLVLDLPGEKTGLPLPGNDFEPERWRYHNYSGIAMKAETMSVLIFQWNKDSRPLPHLPSLGLIQHTKPKLKKIHHFEYACTWFGCAILLFIHWLGITIVPNG